MTGTTFTMETRKLSATATSALMTLGLNTISSLSLDPLGMRGCFLYHSLDLVQPFAVQGGVGRLGVAVPNLPAAVGVAVFAQAAAGVVASNGAELRVGNQ